VNNTAKFIRLVTCKGHASLHRKTLTIENSVLSLNSLKKLIMSTIKDIQNFYKRTGIKNLRDAELLQLLGLKIEDGDIHSLFNKSPEALTKIGYTPTTALKIKALSEIAHRYSSSPSRSLAQLKSSQEAVKIIAPDLKHLQYEEAWVLYLNRAHKVVAKEKISQGGVSSTVVDVKIIMKRALELLSSSLILVHNHPSGNPTPGDADKVQTKALQEAALFFDITLLDHIIIAGNDYFSFADSGIL